MDRFDRLSMVAGVLTSLCVGCGGGAPGGEETNEAAGAVIEPNGVSFNGVSCNGVTLEPLQLDGLSFGGSTLSGVSLVGSSLAGAASDGEAVSGSDLVGATLAGTRSDGSSVTLRIDAVTTGSDPDVLRYAVSSGAAGSDAFEPLCGVDSSGGPVLAIPLAGSWDTSAGTPTGGAHVDDAGTFTFACEGYALAKCVELGYAPWRTVTECKASGGVRDAVARSVPPGVYAHAPRRLLRRRHRDHARRHPGGSCGTTFGIQADDAPTWDFEAEWSPEGAVCVDETRWPTIEDGGGDVQTYIQDHCPTRWRPPGCGGPGSTFFTANGFDVALDVRALLRTRITANP